MPTNDEAQKDDHHRFHGREQVFNCCVHFVLVKVGEIFCNIASIAPVCSPTPIIWVTMPGNKFESLSGSDKFRPPLREPSVLP